MAEDVVNHSQLDERSRVDVFGLGGWTMVPINQVVEIDCKDIILRLRPNIQTSLSLEETPGLQKLLDHQGRRIPSRTKRGASELVSPSKPKIPRLDTEAPPLRSLLGTLATDPVNFLPQPLVRGPMGLGHSAPHHPETPGSNMSTTEPPKPRFPSSYLARSILSGLEEVYRRDGRKVGERYEATFKHTYARSSLSALRTNAALVRPVFGTLDLGAQETITWGALIQTAKSLASPTTASFQPRLVGRVVASPETTSDPLVSAPLDRTCNEMIPPRVPAQHVQVMLVVYLTNQSPLI